MLAPISASFAELLSGLVITQPLPGKLHQVLGGSWVPSAYHGLSVLLKISIYLAALATGVQVTVTLSSTFFTYSVFGAGEVIAKPAGITGQTTGGVAGGVAGGGETGGAGETGGGETGGGEAGGGNTGITGGGLA